MEKRNEGDTMGLIVVMFIALFCVLAILSVGYLLIRKIDDSEHGVYSEVVLQCANIECELNNEKSFYYKISKNNLREVLPCPACKKTRQLIESK